MNKKDGHDTQPILKKKYKVFHDYNVTINLMWPLVSYLINCIKTYDRVFLKI